MAGKAYQVWVPNRPVLEHIPGAALRSGALLLSEGVNANSRHTLLQLAHKTDDISCSIKTVRFGPQNSKMAVPTCSSS